MTINEIINKNYSVMDELAEVFLNNLLPFTPNIDGCSAKSNPDNFIVPWHRFWESCFANLDSNDSWSNLWRTLESKMEEICLQKARRRNFLIKSFSSFYHVGQGLMVAMFLVDAIHVQKASFDLLRGRLTLYAVPKITVHVYDCGSGKNSEFPENKYKVIDDFQDDYKTYACVYSEGAHIPNYIIDYLYISHFDNDHINGITELSKRFQIKNICLAYLDPLTRAEDILSAMTENEGGSDGEAFDPKTCEQKMMIEKAIAEMVSGQTGHINLIEIDAPTFDSLNSNLRSLEQNETMGHFGRSLLFDPEQSYDIQNPSNVVHVYHVYPMTDQNRESVGIQYYFFGNDSWHCLLMYYIPKGGDIDLIREKFLNYLQEAFEDLGDPATDPDWTEKMFNHLMNSDDRATIKKIYLKLGIAGKVNDMSMCFAVSPDKICMVDYGEFVTKYIGLIANYYRTDITFGFNTMLLTGDAKMSMQCDDGDFYQGIIKSLNANGFPELGIILLPHHGSRANLLSDAFQAFESGLTGVPNPKYWVVSYGKNNSYHHPNLDPCRWIGYHYCVQYNETPGKYVFPPATGDQIENIPIYQGDDPDNPVINPHVLFHCHDTSKVTVSTYHEVLNFE